jgi:hypothetical protein
VAVVRGSMGRERSKDSNCDHLWQGKPALFVH